MRPIYLITGQEDLINYFLVTIETKYNITQVSGNNLKNISSSQIESIKNNKISKHNNGLRVSKCSIILIQDLNSNNFDRKSLAYFNTLVPQPILITMTTIFNSIIENQDLFKFLELSRTKEIEIIQKEYISFISYLEMNKFYSILDSDHKINLDKLNMIMEDKFSNFDFSTQITERIFESGFDASLQKLSFMFEKNPDNLAFYPFPQNDIISNLKTGPFFKKVNFLRRRKYSLEENKVDNSFNFKIFDQNYKKNWIDSSFQFNKEQDLENKSSYFRKRHLISRLLGSNIPFSSTVMEYFIKLIDEFFTRFPKKIDEILKKKNEHNLRYNPSEFIMKLEDLPFSSNKFLDIESCEDLFKLIINPKEKNQLNIEWLFINKEEKLDIL